MNKISFTLIYIAISSSLLSGCVAPGGTYGSVAQPDSCAIFNKKMVFGGLAGAATGAAAGALIGRDAKGTAIGAGVGLLLGSLAGAMAARSDCDSAMMALQAMGSAPTNTPVSWSSPTTGHNGSFIPVGAPVVNKYSGRLCRPYVLQARDQSGNQANGGQGITCRDDKTGNWQIVS